MQLCYGDLVLSALDFLLNVLLDPHHIAVNRYLHNKLACMLVFSVSILFLQTVRHGFPYGPTALAYDPVQNLLAIGTKTGSLRMYPFWA